MDDVNSNISIDFLNYQYEILGISPFLRDPDVTEICINPKDGRKSKSIL